MSEKDQQLIQKANDRNMTWEEVSDLEKAAQSEKAKETLRYRKLHLYHNEEYSLGML